MTWILERGVARNKEGDYIFYDSDVEEFRIKNGEVKLYRDNWFNIASLKIENIDMEKSEEKVVEQLEKWKGKKE